MLAVNQQSNSGQDIFILPVWLGPLWSWSYGSWIYNYLCSQCLSLLMLWVRIPPRWGVLDTTFCAKVCQWFSPSTTVSPTNKIDLHDIIEILLKVALNIINQPNQPILVYHIILGKNCLEFMDTCDLRRVMCLNDDFQNVS